MLGLKIFFAFALAAAVYGGILLYKNWDKLFVPNADHPSESSGSLLYGKAQVILVYFLGLKLLAWLIFFEL